MRFCSFLYISKGIPGTDGVRWFRLVSLDVIRSVERSLLSGRRDRWKPSTHSPHRSWSSLCVHQSSWRLRRGINTQIQLNWSLTLLKPAWNPLFRPLTPTLRTQLIMDPYKRRLGGVDLSRGRGTSVLHPFISPRELALASDIDRNIYIERHCFNFGGVTKTITDIF